MPPRQRWTFLCLFLISGACGLIYEIAWSRLLVFVFGGTTFAITTVLACFMAGLALGSFLAGRASQRLPHPARVYGLLEIAIGVYCLFVPLMLRGATPIYRWLVVQTGEAFVLMSVARLLVSAVILIVPTACMGATLPLLSKAFAERNQGTGSPVALLYGVNTAGAFLGCVAVGFVLLPIVGLRQSIWLAAFLNVAAGVTALVISRKDQLAVAAPAEREANLTVKHEKARGKRPVRGSVVSKASDSEFSRPLLLFLYGVSGFAAMAYQVAWTRALILSMGSSTYAFSAIVACYIFGIAAGSLLITRWIDTLRRPLLLAGALEAAIALSALLVVPFFGKMPGVVQALSTSPGAEYLHVLAVEAGLTFCLLFVPTMCMGALMPLVCRIYDPRPEETGRSVGAVYAVNTAGTIVGALFAGFVLMPLPWIGAQNTILAASAFSAMIASVFLIGAPGTSRGMAIAAVSALWIVGIGFGSAAQPWSKLTMASGPFMGRGNSWSKVLDYYEDADATVAVTSDDVGRTLIVNGKPDASTNPLDQLTQYLLAHIPLSLHPNPRQVCIIGLGSGCTAGAALAHPVERVEVAEISGGVIKAARHFEDVNLNALSDPRLALHRTDGRNFLLLSDRKYDLIISEPSNPWMSGIANLFTREHFMLCKERLNPGGLHSQWLHSYSMHPDDFAAILKTFSSVYPYVQLWETSYDDYAIVGSDQPITVDVERLYALSTRREIAGMLNGIKMNDPLQLAHHFVAEGKQLQSLIRSQQELTDDLPRLEFSAPRYLLANQDLFMPVRRFLSKVEGYPPFARSSNGSVNQQFSHVIDSSRQRSKVQVQFMADPATAEEAKSRFKSLAVHGSRDVRTILFLRSFISDLTRSGKEPDMRKAEALAQLAATAVPEIHEFGSLLLQRKGVVPVSWPFNRKPRQDTRQAYVESMEAARRLAAQGLPPTELREAVSKVLALAPDDFDALCLAGRAGLQLRQPDQALAHLLKARAISPEQGEVRYLIARAHAQLQRADQAVEEIRAAMNLGYANRQMLESEADFRSVREQEVFEEVLQQAEP